MYNSMSGNSIVDNMIYEMIFGSRISFDALSWQGGYDASLNTPPSPVSAGYFYVITSPGTFGGIAYESGSFAWFDGTDWFKTPALTTGVTLVNGQTGNVSIDTDNLPVGDNKFLIQEQVDKVDNLPVNTIEELDSKFKKEWNSDKLVEGNNHLFMSVIEKNKLNNLPLNVNDELDKKFNKTSSTDKLVEGNFNLFITQEDKDKLNNVPANTINEINKKLDNTITADNIPDGVNKFILSKEQKEKLDSITEDIATDLLSKFDMLENDTDDIIESTTKKFMSTAEKLKLVNVPDDTNAELITKFDVFNDDMDSIKDGSDYVKTKNNFTDDLKAKLYNLTDNYKGYFLTSIDLETALPIASAGTYAIVEETNSIWIWNDDVGEWRDSTSAGTGDMLRVTYDPSNKAKDVYNMDYMEEGLLNTVITKAERNKLQDIDININTQTVTNEEKVDIGTIKDKLEISDLTDFLTDNTDDTDTIELQFKDDTLKANLLYQNSDTTTISEDVNGLKVDIKDNSSNQKVTIAIDGTIITSKKELNFINNSNITVTAEEDNINDRINIELITSNSGGNNKVKVSDTDTISSYLQNKIVGATDKIDVTIDTIGDNEQLVLNIGEDVFDKQLNNADDITEGLTNLFLTQQEREKIDVLTEGLDFDLIFNKQDDTIDDINDGTDYVKMSLVDKLKLDSLNDVLLFKGTIDELPELDEAKIGDTYIINTDFDTYKKDEVIFFNGIDFVKIKEDKESELPITTVTVNDETKELDRFPTNIVGCKYFYTIKADTNTRIGELMVVHNGTDVKFLDTVVDFDTLDKISFNMEIENNEVVINVTGLDNTWVINFTKIKL